LLASEQDIISSLVRNSTIEGFVSPAYHGQCISNLPDTFANLLAIKTSQPLSNQNFYDFAKSSNIENVLFLLLDGFGFNSIQFVKQNFGFPSFEKLELDSQILPLTSVFPSTTSTATTTIHTGLTPQEHGIIGYTMYMNEIGAITQMLDLGPVFSRKSLFELGFDPAKFVGKRTLHERFAESGVQSNLYINKYIVGSGLSQVTNRGANVFPVLTAPDLFVGVRRNLESFSKGPAFHFAYYASPDQIAHARSPFSQEYAAEVESIFYAINNELREKLDAEIAKKTILMISADHGLCHIDEHDIIDIAKHQELLSMLKVPPTGDSRCLILHAKSEEKISEIEDYFANRFKGIFHLLRSKDALNQGLFGLGEVKEQVHDRIGDLIAVPKTDNAVDNSNVQPRNEYVPGRHGGLSSNEMIVPLVTTRLG
jgi:predicted AlkP superfamily pyrophosphatase or phosphodiesterase